MRRRMFLGCACLLAAGGVARAQQHPQFGYSGASGPAHWGGISEHWAACSAGRNQSPVNLTRLAEAELAPLELSYPTFAADVINNGHAVQVNYRPGSTLRIDGRAFTLLQFHFHSPSEHHLDGRDFPLEAHLVHQDEHGNLAVVAVLFEEAAPNDLINLVWASMPGGLGQRRMLGNAITAMGLLPANRHYLRYSGSLTTPPCTEGVLWVVMRERMTVSRDQVQTFERALGFANNRPVQPVNARALLRARGTRAGIELDGGGGAAMRVPPPAVDAPALRRARRGA
jgi:carbonic anhydrase